MTVDEFLTWAAGEPGRYELYNGAAYAMTPERAGHAKTKLAVHIALIAAVRRAGILCHVLPDGMTVRIDDITAHEPDALVYCGAELPASALEVPNPVVVVEVLSPSTRHIDASTKLAGYFRVPGIAHYLAIDSDRRTVIHHKRGDGALIETRMVSEGALQLDPPGLELEVADLFEVRDTR
jgi:Uma2 family endonuclease